MKRFSSLRDYLEALRELDELVEISREVDWNLEMGAIARRCYEIGAPAPMFNAVKDAPGFRAVAALIGESRKPGLRLSRVALTLGLSPYATAREIVDALVAVRHRSLIPPRRVVSGPVKENVLHGDDVNMLSLPLPLLHDGDGGRYLNTLGVIVVRSPDGSRTNWSVARIMVVDERHGTGTVYPFQHLGEIHRMWRDAGEDMPFALALGVEPMILFAAGIMLPREIDERDFVGAYHGEPVEVVQCETNDLEVPATSEIVIEGIVSATEMSLEGPMGDYGGYMYPDKPQPMPVYRFDAMTFRDEPIFPFASAGEPPEEDHTITGVGAAAISVHALREAGLPVATAWSPFESALGWLVITVTDDWREVEPDSLTLCRRIAETAISTKGHGFPVKTFVVLEDDVDPANLGEVIWALDGRNDRRPEKQVYIDDVAVAPMSPYLFPPGGGDHAPHAEPRTRIVHNCLPPPGVARAARTGFKHNFSAELQREVMRNWESDGFPPDPESAAVAPASSS